MSEQSESSVQVNLKELISLEQARRAEAAEAERQERFEEQRRVAEMEALRRAKQQALAQAEKEAELEHKQREREEAERKEREREAATARATIEAEAVARAEALERQLAHERALAEIAAKRRRGVHPAALMAVVALFAGALLGGYVGIVRPEIMASERRIQATVAQLDALTNPAPAAGLLDGIVEAGATPESAADPEAANAVEDASVATPESTPSHPASVVEAPKPSRSCGPGTGKVCRPNKPVKPDPISLDFPDCSPNDPICGAI